MKKNENYIFLYDANQKCDLFQTHSLTHTHTMSLLMSARNLLRHAVSRGQPLACLHQQAVRSLTTSQCLTFDREIMAFKIVARGDTRHVLDSMARKFDKRDIFIHQNLIFHQSVPLTDTLYNITIYSIHACLTS